MVDFLTRLAERTLRTVPTAQPVLASRFAPGQMMPAPILEAEAWSTAGAAPTHDPASAFRAEADSVTATQGEPGDPGAYHQEQEVLVEGNRMVSDRVGPNQPGMDSTGTSSTSSSPIQLANDAKGAMRQGDPPPNEVPSAGWNAPDSLLYTQGSSSQSGYSRGDSLWQEVHEAASPRSGLPGPQTGITISAEQPDEQDSVGAELIAPSVPSPQPLITQLPTVTRQLPEEADTSEMATKDLILARQARTLHLAPASGMTSQQGEPLALEQEETISPQPPGDHNKIVPPTPAEQVGMSLKPDTSFNPLVEKTFDSIVASHSQTLPPIKTTASRIHAGKAVTDQEQLNAASARNQGDRKESPLLHRSPFRETYIVGAPLAGALPGLRDQGQTVPPTGDQKGNKPDPNRSQPPSPPRTIGQVDVLPVEQHLLVSQAQFPAGIAPQEQTDGPLINVFPSGSARNLSPATLAQHSSTDLQSDSLTGSATEAPPTPPSIHITIGRIDVRAVTSPGPTPPARPTRPSPLLSLDDYLKQGKGGRP